jgi:competence protein ComEC
MLSVWRRPLHVSWVLAWFSIALIGGIAVSDLFLNPALAKMQVSATGFMLLAATLTKQYTTKGLVVVAITAGLLLGLWRGEVYRLKLEGYQVFFGRTVELNATIADDATVKNGTSGLRLRNIHVNGQSLGGMVWVSTSTNMHFKRGDQVGLSGKLRPGFGSYAASMSFIKIVKTIRFQHNDPSRDIRDAFDAGLERTVPQPEAALGIGYLTGQHNMVPDGLIKQMQTTGLIHLVIAGGYNVTILVRLVRRLCSRVAKRLAIFVSYGVLLGLTLIAGFVAPMARTTIVTGLSLAAWYYGRWPHPLVLLPVAAAITALIEPSFVWGDVGWYMTFIAYGGLIVLGPMLKRWWWGDHHSGEVKQIIVDTVAVQIVTTPLMAFAFQQYSIYGLPANLMVLPFMSLTMLSTAVAGLGGMLLPPAQAHWISWPANVLLSYTHKVTAWIAGAPGANFGSGVGVYGLISSYLVIVLFIWRLKHKTGYDFRSENMVE